MALPTSRTTFKDWILRDLGSPVIDINVDDEQVEDRIDEALERYREQHGEGTQRALYKHTITLTDKTNGYVTLPDSIIGVSHIVPIGGAGSANSLFNINYQYHLNEMWNIMHGQFLDYHMAMTRIAELQLLFIGEKPYRFNKHTNILYIDMDWTLVNADEILLIDCHQVLDPEVYTDVWKDHWLRKYAAALVKRQWGSNLKKFQGVVLVGGQTFNGQGIFDEANGELLTLEERLRDEFAIPPDMLIG